MGRATLTGLSHAWTKPAFPPSLTAYGVLSRGVISGHWQKDAHAEGNARNRRGEGCQCGPDRLALVSAQGRDIVPLVGARRRERLADRRGIGTLS
jgi:hypothetical protein